MSAIRSRHQRHLQCKRRQLTSTGPLRPFDVGLQPLRDGRDVIESARCDRHDEVVRVVVGHGESPAVQPVEGNDGGQPEPLVAVDQGVVADDGVQQRGCLLVDGDIRVGAERRRLRASRGCLQQTDVTQFDGRPVARSAMYSRSSTSR